MPFNEPNNLQINVLQIDIDNASANSQNNSIAQALKRKALNYELPGMPGDGFHQSCAFYGELNPRLFNGGVLSLVDVFVCTAVYGADTDSALIIAAENLGQKPSGPYTCNLTRG